MSCVIVTGGYGFIGSNFIKHLFDNTDDIIYNIDSLTYAADQKNIPEKIRESGRYNSIVADISQVNFIDPWNSFTTLLRKTKTIYHFAAESHVDNSITGPSIFVDTNVKGTFNLLEAAKKFDIEFVHVSTDEVYGTLGFFDDPFTEDTVQFIRHPKQVLICLLKRIALHMVSKLQQHVAAITMAHDNTLKSYCLR